MSTVESKGHSFALASAGKQVGQGKVLLQNAVLSKLSRNKPSKVGRFRSRMGWLLSKSFLAQAKLQLQVWIQGLGRRLKRIIQPGPQIAVDKQLLAQQGH